MEHDGDDDPVVKEMDIYSSKDFANELFILQFPLTPFGNADATVKFSSSRYVRMKPNQLKLEIKVPLNTESKAYNKMKAEQIAADCVSAPAATPSNVKNVSLFEGKRMDFQKFVTANATGLCKHTHAVAVVENDKLFLHPVKALLQMHHTFDYLDAADEKAKHAQSTVGVESGGEKSSHDDSEIEQPQAITVRFAKEESEASKKRRQASYAFQERMKSEEPWRALQYYDETSFESSQKRKKLSKASPDFISAASLDVDVDTERYLRMLSPSPAIQEISVPRLPTNIISLADLRRLPLPDQIRQLMINVKVIRFHQLRTLLPPGVDLNLVLKHLQQFAVLVQGCWVVKSSILYPDDSKSAKTGIVGSVLCCARDLVLYHFLQNRVIVRKQLSELLKIPNDDMSDILSQFAKFRQQKGWEFIYPADTEFIDCHRNVVERQQTLWKDRYQYISQVFSSSRPRRTSGGQNSTTAEKVRKRTGSKSLSFSMSSEDEHFAAASTADSAADSKSKASRSRQRQPSDASKMASVRPSRDDVECSVNSVIGQRGDDSQQSFDVAEAEATSLTANTSSTTVNAERTRVALTNFLQEEFQKCPVLHFEDLKRCLLLKMSELPAGSVLRTCDITDQLIETCAVTELKAEKLNIGGQLSVVCFVATEKQPHVELRRILVDLFRQQQRITLAIFKEACSKRPEVTLAADSELRKILKDYCVQKSGTYTLKKN